MAAVTNKPLNHKGLTQGKFLSYSSKISSYFLRQVESLPTKFQGPRLLPFKTSYVILFWLDAESSAKEMMEPQNGRSLGP